MKVENEAIRRAKLLKSSKGRGVRKVYGKKFLVLNINKNSSS